ncbi:VOC family protein [Solilutibacter silvestris]|uniref:VOC family protein n=1 Tax=Solilutibacter silvestris TaxID=1645665 RepID=UPI003D331429
MTIRNIIAQLRTTDLERSIDFYTSKLGMTLEFRYQDFYAGIRSGDRILHLKHVDERDPSIHDVREHGHFHLYFEVDDVRALAGTLRERGVALVSDVHDTDWQTREFVVEDDQGHTLYFGQPL